MITFGNVSSLTLAVSGLCCCVRLSLVRGARALQYWQLAGSAPVVCGFRCSEARGVFLERGWNPCLPHWQVDSQPLSHQGSPFNLHKGIKLHIIKYWSKSIWRETKSLKSPFPLILDYHSLFFITSSMKGHKCC